MKNWITGLAISVPMIASALPAWAQPSADRGTFWHDGWGWGHMMFGSFMMILFWGGLIVLIVLAVRGLSGRSDSRIPPSSGQQTAMDILKERFAKGEIDKEEYEERKKLLSE